MIDFFQDRRPHEGLTYTDYQAQWAAAAGQPLDGLDRQERKSLYYKRYNLERSGRVYQAYEVSATLRQALARIGSAHLWMVLTEDWCVDSAYSLPVIVEAARLNPHIDLRILRRDNHLDVMAHYLTGRSQSIPKLVAFTMDGAEVFRWGPRPAPAQALRENLQQKGVSGGALSKALIDWYEEGGWEVVDAELAAALDVALQPTML